jgi:hypothetical protein
MMVDLPLPRTTKGKLEAVVAVLKSDVKDSRFAVQKVRAKDFQRRAEKHYEKKYGKKNVQTQKHSRHSGKYADIAVGY